ncbi:MAG: sigma-70 family RNA polymerase sigma factor [Anaerohalosphaera sp.]|nr:sigma-70 family RNA polymerase sigma factor [Anaerohalosphaera sp.]
MSDLKNDKYESFLKLYRKNEVCIFRYIIALLPNYSAAEDVMQDTMLVMWRKYDQFRPGSNFVAWGMQIARFGVLKYHQKNKPGIVHFDTDAMNNLTKHKMITDSNKELYLEALDECTKGLSDNCKQMIVLRYVENMKVTDIALKMQKSLNSTYKVMSRIHHALLNCIERKMAKGEMA